MKISSIALGITFLCLETLPSNKRWTETNHPGMTISPAADRCQEQGNWPRFSGEPEDRGGIFMAQIGKNQEMHQKRYQIIDFSYCLARSELIMYNIIETMDSHRRTENIAGFNLCAFHFCKPDDRESKIIDTSRRPIREYRLPQKSHHI